MSNEYVWQPEGDQENAILAAANHLLRFGHPPVGERLCRRAANPAAQPDELERLRDEVARLRDALMQSEMDHLIRDTYGVPAQGAGVPEEIRSVLHAALILYITECRDIGDADGEMYARQAQQWLDSQRQGQQQEADE